MGMRPTFVAVGIALLIPFAVLLTGGHAILMVLPRSSVFHCIDGSPELFFRFRASCREITRSESGEISLRYNRQGVRGPDYPIVPPRGVHRILLLGSSQVATPAFPEDEMLAAQLERRLRAAGLRAEVVNGGTQGYVPLQSFLQLPELLSAYHPELVVYAPSVGMHFQREQILAEHVERDPAGIPLRFRFDLADRFRFVPGARDWIYRDSLHWQAAYATYLAWNRFLWSWRCLPQRFAGEDRLFACLAGSPLESIRLLRDRTAATGAKFLFLTFGEGIGTGIPIGPDVPSFVPSLISAVTPYYRLSPETLRRALAGSNVPTFFGEAVPADRHAKFLGDSIHLNREEMRAWVESVWRAVYDAAVSSR
jgi:hypothetical protein